MFKATNLPYFELFTALPGYYYNLNIGEDPKIEVNYNFTKISDVWPCVLGRIAQMSADTRPFEALFLKEAKTVSRGVICDVKETLRNKVNAIKVNDTTVEGNAFLKF